MRHAGERSLQCNKHRTGLGVAVTPGATASPASGLRCSTAAENQKEGIRLGSAAARCVTLGQHLDLSELGCLSQMLGTYVIV